jgi:hypothetical protein
MTDAIPSIWFDLLTGRNPDQITWAIDEVERLLRDLPPSGARDHGLDVIEAARAGDVDAQRQLANSLAHVYCRLPHAKTPTRASKPRKARKPSVGKMIAAAERGGKSVTSITTPDGVTLHFAKDTEASNPWLDDLVTKQ